MERTRRIEERLNHRLAISKELEPPWARFPWIERSSTGWRMGSGGDWLELFGHFVTTRCETVPSLVAYLRRHPPAPRTWQPALVHLLATVTGVDEEDPAQHTQLAALVAAEGLTADDAAYPVFVRSELRDGSLPAVWTRWDFDPVEALRYGGRELSFWARWLATECASRRAWLAAQPPAPEAWQLVAEAARTADAGAPWSDPAVGAGPLVVALAARGTLPPPWTAGLTAIDEVDWELTADARHAWAWWVSSTFDDAASFTAYLQPTPPPPVWDAALRQALFPWLYS